MLSNAYRGRINNTTERGTKGATDTHKNYGQEFDIFLFIRHTHTAERCAAD